MDNRGFTLLEVVFAMTFIAIGVIATAPLFVFAMQQTATGGDLGEVGVHAVQRMELLRGTPYPSLSSGGSLTANVNGYFDDSDPDVLVRWVISANPNPPTSARVVTVRAIANRQTVGARKRVTVTTLRGG